jgi:hypothetical protein
VRRFMTASAGLAAAGVVATVTALLATG